MIGRASRLPSPPSLCLQAHLRHAQISPKSSCRVTLAVHQPQLGWLQIYGEHLQDAHNTGARAAAAAACALGAHACPQLIGARVWAAGLRLPTSPTACSLVPRAAAYTCAICFSNTRYQDPLLYSTRQATRLPSAAAAATWLQAYPWTQTRHSSLFHCLHSQ